jgi:hypothetical protein
MRVLETKVVEKEVAGRRASPRGHGAAIAAYNKHQVK